MAELDGLLDIFFTGFTPGSGTHVFDLVVTDFINGIIGDFDPGGVSIFDLDPNFVASAGIVVDSINGSDVEIYRLTISGAIQAVTERTTGLLVLMALPLLVVLGKRRWM